MILVTPTDDAGELAKYPLIKSLSMTFRVYFNSVSIFLLSTALKRCFYHAMPNAKTKKLGRPATGIKKSRVNVSIEKTALKAVQALATKADMSLSGYISMVLENKIKRLRAAS